ncbi:XRE family transcriptional regulator [Streptomyces sp. AJS327]|uniref:helix-turn-helix domain-containing protein n=1 Tax=Streptomyces sp. AJS327 TaxID=2545265 RepID=UPI0015DE34F5|nr:helix-turn-helix domain-containing protein [Streptomyces sp. AJS327]MBA0053940.1 XRE family transcriptional regulator [Streptomyces sp. AJS327]
MRGDAHSSELGEFLRARRARISPQTAGLPDTGAKRRVQGLRREEVALLASISTDYYTRLEQGRRRASVPVLETLARVLRLDEEERAYLFALAGKDAAGRRERPATQRVRPQLRRLLDDLASSPAMVLGRRMDILAWNPLAAALITDFGRLPERQRNHAWLLFTDPDVRALHADWENVAHSAVAMLRREAGQNPHDQRMASLVGELSMRDADFRRWWAEHHVMLRRRGSKVLRHPVAGEMALDWDALTCAGDPDQQLIVWSAEAGSPAHDGLRILASWSTGQGQASPASPAP